jgi:hypothetical protein
MIDFNSSFGDMFIGYTGERYSEGEDDTATGRWIPGSKSPLSFRGMPPQPLSGTEVGLVKLEDGQKVEDVRKIYTEFELFVRRGGADADIVNIDSDKYQVTSVSPRHELGGHRKVIVVKMQGDSGS